MSTNSTLPFLSAHYVHSCSPLSSMLSLTPVIQVSGDLPVLLPSGTQYITLSLAISHPIASSPDHITAILYLPKLPLYHSQLLSFLVLILSLHVSLAALLYFRSFLGAIHFLVLVSICTQYYYSTLYSNEFNISITFLS